MHARHDTAKRTTRLERVRVGLMIYTEGVLKYYSTYPSSARINIIIPIYMCVCVCQGFNNITPRVMSTVWHSGNYVVKRHFDADKAAR